MSARRRARPPRGHLTGKTVKLKRRREDSSLVKMQNVSSNCWLLPAIFLLLLLTLNFAACQQQQQQQDSSAPRPLARGAQAPRQSRKMNIHETPQTQRDDFAPDPMEPCYLAHNRASETLTISESTPVGTIVGELMVNGDSSEDGNIELSIKMPGGNVASMSEDNPGFGAALDHPGAGHDGRSAAHQSNVRASHEAHLPHGVRPTQRSGLLHDETVDSAKYGGRNTARREQSVRGRVNSPVDRNEASDQEVSAGRAHQKDSAAPKTGAKNTRDLGHLIDLMPPLSIEQGTKRLILAKKLDRENLDKYMGSYQSSTNSISQSSSASLTVHIKCQLRDRSQSSDAKANATTTNNKPSGVGSNSTSTTTPVATPSGGHTNKYFRKSSPSLSKKSSTTNSILIPIHLIVTDENDNWPNFIGWPYIIDLNETAQVGSLLQGNEIVAVDNDQQGPLSTIEYSIVAGSFWSDSFGFLNPLDSRSLIVKDNRLFDYESQSKLTLKVMARDQGEPPNWAITSLYVNLIDQDDLSPVFSEDKYFGFVKDNRPGEKIDLLPTRMMAHDGDRTLATPVTYSFHMKTNHSIHFELDPDLGQLTLKKTIPDAQHQTFCLLVRATQVDNAQRFSLTAVNLKLAKFVSIRSHIDPTNSSASTLLPTGANREGPKFSHSNYTVEVSEAALVGSTILTASASHKHLEETVTYQLLDNEAGYLNIDKLTGRLTLNKSLDYELFRRITVRILATTEQIISDTSGGASSSSSSAYPKLACDIARVNINVINHNDYAPEFSHEQYNFQLSISDLIANFEPSARLRHDMEEDSALASGRRGPDKMSHRFGEIELEDALDELDYRAIQLGQVYCADRDHGDRVSLRLAGSKASLFHLTQDGRLYLPLVNVSSFVDYSQRPPTGRQDSGPDGRQSSWNSKSSSRIINNQFSMSRAFSASTRRSDNSLASDSLDRSYLNYLLNELSNLGRLRLKVHATDGGQPEAKQSTALVIVTIISIDNFIIQRGQSYNSGGGGGDSSVTGRGDGRESDQDISGMGGDKYSSQVIMIPSMNGREFVHVDPDIIGNLLSGSKNFTRTAGPSGDLKVRSPMPDTLDSAASNTLMTSALRPHDPLQPMATATSRLRQQPPGLLMIDDDGAKFVAMPAAIEVYNQQVQEAAGQQARQKSRYDRESDRNSAGTLWAGWGNKLGPIDNWTSVSAAVLLHIVVVLLIIGLATRIRSYVATSHQNSDGIGGHGSSGFEPERHSQNRRSSWPRRISNLGSFFVAKSGGGGGDSASDILNQHQSTASIYGNVASSLPQSSRIDQQHAYSASYTNHSATLEDSPPAQRAEHHQRYRQQAGVVSSGTVVSAMSNAPTQRHSPRRQQAVASDQSSPRPATESVVSRETRNQQNLFDHLKLTLNKMMDTSNADGHVSMRPLDSDVVAFEDQRDRQLDDRAQYRETSELQLHQREERTAISTFVGQSASSSTSQKSPTLTAGGGKRADSSSATARKVASTVVSINVVATSGNQQLAFERSGGIRRSSPTSDSTREMTAPKGKTYPNYKSSGSSSSVVSLGSSVASSLSNKISEAVGKEQATGSSDASSLNSSILLQGCTGGGSSPGGSSVNGKLASSKPPAPPPLPPPPSQIRVGCSPSASNSDRSPASMSPKYANGLVRVGDFASSTSNARRQAIPANPVYSRLKRETLPDRGNRQVAAHKPSSPPGTVLGRRDARNQANVRVRPPSPPPMPTSSGLIANKRPPGAATSSKTVSPTTSVDRGYESFQSSYDHPGSQPRATRQFSSLQDYEPAGGGGGEMNQGTAYVSSLPAYTTSGHRETARKVVMPSQTLRSSQAGVKQSRAVRTLSERRPLGKAECDTEDDDFYYCCSEITQADALLHQLPPSGDLLSDYASHSYNQQQQQSLSCQATSAPRRSLGRAGGGRLATTTITSSNRRNISSSTSNQHHDLISYPCDYQQQDAAVNMNQVCDIAPQLKRTTGPNNAGQQRRQQMPTLGRQSGATAARQKQQRLAYPSQTVSLGDGYQHYHQQPSSGSGSKKQLTWSDQVELDPY